MVNTVWDRLEPLMREHGYTVSSLAKKLGVSYQAIGKVKDGGNFGTSNNLAAAKLFGVRPEWLAQGEPPMTLPVSQPVDEQKGLTPINASSFRTVWVVGRGSGGKMPERIWTDGDYPVGITDEYAEVMSPDPHAFLAEVWGDSMVPRYNPGEFFLVEPGTEPEIEDDVLVRLEDGQTLLKRLLSRRGGYRLGSYNTDEVLFVAQDKITWMYYVAHPVPRRRIKSRL